MPKKKTTKTELNRVLLSVGERFSLINTLAAATGDITTIKILPQLRDRLALSEAEHQKYGIKVQGSSITWDPARDTPTPIEIGPVASGLITQTLEGLNKSKQLTEAHIPLWEKFCTGNGK